MSHGSLVKDARKFSYGWRIWFWVMVLMNLVAPLFFLPRTSAWLVLISAVIAGTVITVLHRKLGWVRLLGVGHFHWMLLVPFLVIQVITTSPAGIYAAWLLAVIVVDLVSLVIDVADVTRYVRGERQPIVA